VRTHTLFGKAHLCSGYASPITSLHTRKSLQDREM
jgi:hypothetical protein